MTVHVWLSADWIQLIWRRIGEKSLAEWLTVFEGAAFPYGPVNNIQEVFSDPQVGANVYAGGRLVAVTVMLFLI